MTAYTAHIDGFARANMPPEAEWPLFNRAPPFDYPERLNVAALLDRAARLYAERPALRSPHET